MNRFNINKLINIIIFYHNHTNPEKLNKTKILKLLFLSDFKHIEKFGRPIKFDIYFHLPKGPVPTLSKNLLDNLKSDSDIDWDNEFDVFKKALTIRKIKNLLDKYNPNVIVPKKNRQFDDMFFSESEIEILNMICKKYYNSTATELINITHRHKGYKLTEENEEIDYRYGFKTKDDVEYYNFREREKKEFELIR